MATGHQVRVLIALTLLSWACLTWYLVLHPSVTVVPPPQVIQRWIPGQPNHPLSQPAQTRQAAVDDTRDNDISTPTSVPSTTVEHTPTAKATKASSILESVSSQTTSTKTTPIRLPTTSPKATQIPQEKSSEVTAAASSDIDNTGSSSSARVSSSTSSSSTSASQVGSTSGMTEGGDSPASTGKRSGKKWWTTFTKDAKEMPHGDAHGADRMWEVTTPRVNTDTNAKPLDDLLAKWKERPAVLEDGSFHQSSVRGFKLEDWQKTHKLIRDIDNEEDKDCDLDFGYGFFRDILKEETPFCNNGVLSRMDCRPYTHRAMTWKKNRPLNPCDFVGLTIDFSKMAKRTVPKKVDGKAAGYHTYAKGAFQVNCDKTEAYDEMKFARHNVREMLKALVAKGPDVTPKELEADYYVMDRPVLIFQRDSPEHLWHGMTEWTSMWQTLDILGLRPDNTYSLLMGTWERQPFDGLWKTLFSPTAPVLRVKHFKKKKVWIKHAVFVPPGWGSWIQAKISKSVFCFGDPLHDFGAFSLNAYGVPIPTDYHHREVTRSKKVINIIFISRKRKRTIKNEDKVMAAIKASLPDEEAHANKIDFASLSVKQQLEKIANCDILIGMHGAGLAHIAFLAKHAAIVEILPSDWNKWKVYNNIAHMKGIVYEKVKQGASGGVVDIGRFKSSFKRAYQRWRERHPTPEADE